MQQILIDRQIEWLLHFTRAENLTNIFHYGLLPRSVLEFNNIDFSYNDYYRYDNCENAVCTTVEFPNYKMFYRLRCDNPDTDWAVLLLDSQVICDYKCAFCTTNAGSEDMYSIPIDQRKGKKAFKKLFEELPNGPTRKQLGIKDWYPTNPQAEVLVFENIPNTYIKAVLFKNVATLNKYNNVIPKSITAKVDNDVFYGRADWQYWK